MEYEAPAKKHLFYKTLPEGCGNDTIQWLISRKHLTHPQFNNFTLDESFWAKLVE